MPCPKGGTVVVQGDTLIIDPDTMRDRAETYVHDKVRRIA